MIKSHFNKNNLRSLISLTFCVLTFCVNAQSSEYKKSKKANFIIAYKITEKYEGGYVNDPRDNGGETYKGVSRKSNPNWEGWTIIDSCKKSNKNFKKILPTIIKLESTVQKLFKRKYWDKMRGDEFIDQDMANKLYDTCVNMGVTTAIRIFQESFLGLSINKSDSVISNLIKKRGMKYGQMDDKTLNMANSLF